MNKWRCGNCGYRLEAMEPPTTCPSCKQKCEFIDDYFTAACALSPSRGSVFLRLATGCNL